MYVPKIMLYMDPIIKFAVVHPNTILQMELIRSMFLYYDHVKKTFTFFSKTCICIPNDTHKILATRQDSRFIELLL